MFCNLTTNALSINKLRSLFSFKMEATWTHYCHNIQNAPYNFDGCWLKVGSMHTTTCKIFLVSERWKRRGSAVHTGWYAWWGGANILHKTIPSLGFFQNGDTPQHLQQNQGQETSSDLQKPVMWKVNGNVNFKAICPANSSLWFVIKGVPFHLGC